MVLHLTDYLLAGRGGGGRMDFLSVAMNLLLRKHVYSDALCGGPNPAHMYHMGIV